MTNLIQANRTLRRSKAQLKELDDRRHEALKRIADALADLSDGMVAMGLPPMSPRQLSDTAQRMRDAVLDFTDGHETDLAIAQQKAELEIETTCWERGLHEGVTLNALQNAEHARDRVNAAIASAREGSSTRHVRAAWQHYRRHIAEAFRPVERPLFVQLAKPAPAFAQAAE